MCSTEYMYTSGTGGYKLGANYAPGVVPAKEAAALGYAQNLWLHGPEHYLTEVGLFAQICSSDDPCYGIGRHYEHVCRVQTRRWW